jgi:hypothetical protein
MRNSIMIVVVQRPGELPESYERFALPEQARACRDMLIRSEPFWSVWLDGKA